MFGMRKKDQLDSSAEEMLNRINSQKVIMPEAKKATSVKEPIVEEKITENPVRETVKSKSNGNGKKAASELHDTVPITEAKAVKPIIPTTSKVPIKQELTENMNNTQDDLEKELEYQRLQHEIDEEARIPGNGWYLGQVRDKHLPMMTVLDRGEVLTFALGNMQENMLTQSRTDSLFRSFARDIMQMNISIKGRGRDDAAIARQQDADKNVTTNNIRDLTARPGSL